MPGTYYETAWVRYNGMAMPPDAENSYQHRQTATIDSSLLMAISTIALDTGKPLEFLAQLQQVSSIASTQILFTVLCPTQEVARPYYYDASPGAVTFYYTDGYGPFSYTLTKQ